MKHSVKFLLNFYYSNGVNAFLVLFALPKNTRIFHLHIYLYMTEHFIILCNIIFLIYFSYHFSILFWGSKMQNFKFGNAELFISHCLCKTNCYIAVILGLKKKSNSSFNLHDNRRFSLCCFHFDDFKTTFHCRATSDFQNRLSLTRDHEHLSSF